MHNAPLTVGIIGCGTITRNVHVPVLQATPQARLVWLADTSAATGGALSRASGVPFHEVPRGDIALPQADVVVIAIPNGARSAYYKYLRSTPATALYVEKPLAKSLDEHLAIVDGRAPSSIAVGLDRRSFGITRLVQQLFTYRPFGQPLTVRIEFGGLGRVLMGDTFMTNPALAGGGTLFQMGVHFLDTLIYASQALDVSMRGGRLINSEGLDVHVEADLDIMLPESVNLPVSLLVTQLQFANNRIAIEFESASVSFSIMYGERALEVTPRGTGRPTWKLSPDITTGPMDVFASFGMHWRNALEAFRTGTENYTSASQSLLTSKVLGLLYSLPAEGDS